MYCYCPHFSEHSTVLMQGCACSQQQGAEGGKGLGGEGRGGGGMDAGGELKGAVPQSPMTRLQL